MALAAGGLGGDTAAGTLRGPGRIRTSVGVNRQVYSLLPLATRTPTRRRARLSGSGAPVYPRNPELGLMPTFDLSGVDR